MPSHQANDQPAETSLIDAVAVLGLRDKNKRPLQISNAPNPLSIIVTMDRVDPFATYLPDGGKRENEPIDGTWLINIADLMLVTDILTDPAEFFGYAHTRVAVNKAGGPRVFVEVDALNIWCQKRLKPTTPPPGGIVLLDQQPDIINQYYTNTDFEQPTQRPTAGTPPQILAALQAIQAESATDWQALALGCMNVAPAEWHTVMRRLRSLLPKANPTRSQRKRQQKIGDGVELSSGVRLYAQSAATAGLPAQPMALRVDPR